MNIVGTIIIVSIVMIGLFAVIWRLLFGARNRKTIKSSKKTKVNVKQKLSVTSAKRRNEQFIAISNLLNIIPFFRLTKENRDEINRRLSASTPVGSTIKIAEELHVESWAITLVWSLFVIFISFFWTPLILGLVAVFFLRTFPYRDIGLSATAELEAVEENFIDFYGQYYVQFQRKKQSLKLLDVVLAYKGFAPPSMATFISRLEVDLATGEYHALRMLDKRYNSNPSVHRFCAIAAIVSRGESNADRVVDGFQDELSRNSLLKRRKVVQKRKDLVAKVHAALLYVLAVSIMILALIFTMVVK